VESVNGNAIGHKKPQIKKQNKSKLNSTACRNQKNNRFPEQTSLYSMFHHSQIREISFDL